MTDIRSPRLLYLKGFLFLMLGVLAGGLLLFHAPSWRVALLLAITVWAFCRAYYFAFYVIEHYIDGDYKFAGLYDFAKYALRRRREKQDDAQRTRRITSFRSASESSAASAARRSARAGGRRARRGRRQ